MVYIRIICRKPNTPESLADTFLSLWEAIANLQGEKKVTKYQVLVFIKFVWGEPYNMVQYGKGPRYPLL